MAVLLPKAGEAKVLGIRMAGPWFEVEERAREIGVVEFSSNYELYANMSHRFHGNPTPVQPDKKSIPSMKLSWISPA